MPCQSLQNLPSVDQILWCVPEIIVSTFSFSSWCHIWSSELTQGTWREVQNSTNFGQSSTRTTTKHQETGRCEECIGRCGSKIRCTHHWCCQLVMHKHDHYHWLLEWIRCQVRPCLSLASVHFSISFPSSLRHPAASRQHNLLLVDDVQVRLALG